jgi:RNA polymerase sigma-70 factor (ECF subfamily)
MMGVMAEPLGVIAAVEAGRETRVQDFGDWMTAEQRRVFLLCQHMLQDLDEAASAAQDTFLKAFRVWRKTGFGDLDDPAKWVTRIAVNTCLDRLRSRRWQFWRWGSRQAGQDVVLTLAADSRPSSEDRVLGGEIARRLGEALERLSPRQRAVFTLRHFEDRSLDEIGGILGLDTGTVKAHLFRALTKLRNELRDLYGARGASQ